MNKQDIEDVLLELPGEIKTASIKLLDIFSAEGDQSNLLESIRKKHLRTVLDAKENGKPKYTNAEQRSMALEAMLGADGEYHHNQEVLKDITRDRQLVEIELHRLVNYFSAVRAVAGLQGGQE